MEQRITELVNLVQTQGNQIQTLADELREVNRKNTLLENNLRNGSTNLKLPTHPHPSAHTQNDVGQNHRRRI